MDKFMETISTLRNIVQSSINSKSTKNVLKLILKCLNSKQPIQMKQNALLYLIHLSQNETIKQEIGKNGLLFDFIANICQQESNDLNILCLEIAKYFGTVLQLDNYKQLIEEFINKGIDFPNSYNLIDKLQEERNKMVNEIELDEKEILHQFQQILYDHQLDLEALSDIVNTYTQNENYKIMLEKYKVAFDDRIIQISKLQNINGIFTQFQLNQLTEIYEFESQYINNCKSDSAILKWLSVKLNLQLRQIQQESKSILIIENPTSERSRTNINRIQEQSFEINPFEQQNQAFKKEFLRKLSQVQNQEISDKNYFGKLVNEKLDTTLLYQYDEKQLKKIKRACLKNKQRLFDSHELQIGVVSQILQKDELFQSFLQINLYIGNKTKHQLMNCELSFDNPIGLQLWLPENNIGTIINSRQQVKQSFLIAYQHELFKPLEVQFQWIDNSTLFEAKFLIPCLLSRFMKYKTISRAYFKHIWHKKREFCQKSELFRVNAQVLKHPFDLQLYIPQLCPLTNLQDFFDLKKDLKFGGEFTLQDIRKESQIKFIIRQNGEMLIKVIGLQDAVEIVKCLVFILSE